MLLHSTYHISVADVIALIFTELGSCSDVETSIPPNVCISPVLRKRDMSPLASRRGRAGL